MANGSENSDDKTQTHHVLTQGTMVAQYRIIKKIGAGGMGEVYLAEDTELNRKVALKFLPPHLCQDEDCRKRFKREAQAAAKLSHPNIIHVYEVSEYQGRPFFAMEHVEGLSLKDYGSGKELSVEQILELGIQICEGLNDAHEKGITHRDIKPSNILIDSHGRAKIVDFGLASVVGTDQLTKTGSTLGTIGYMSPEQVQGKEIDHRSDLFSLGVVLYELITKQNPFKRDSEAATLKAVSDDLPEPLARFKTGLPDGLQAIIDKALEKDVKTRYQHADGMLSDLMRLKRSLDLSWSTTSAVSVTGRSVWSWWVAGALVVVAAAVVLLLTKPWVTEIISDQPDKIMLAVLPFENLGDPADEYFADGITEEIIGKLAKLSGLGVISRTSSMQYKATDKGLRQIGEELGVDYVLEGTIRWDQSAAENRIRIQPQLIDVRSDLHLWSSQYDTVLTSIFEIQSSIAQEVTEALGVELLRSERDALAHVRTANPEAYDYYLRGNQYSERLDESARRNAVRMYRKAIELEPGFAMAYLRLAMAHSEIYWQTYDLSDARLDSAEAAINAATAISPDLPEIHLARGTYIFRGLNDFPRALEELQVACRKLPNNSDARLHFSKLLSHLNRWEDAEVELRKAIELDPRAPRLLYDLASLLMGMRRYEAADSVLDRLIELQPDYEMAYEARSLLALHWKGTTEAAWRILDDAMGKTGRQFHCFNQWLELLDNEFESALAILTDIKDCNCTWLTKHFCIVRMGDLHRFLNQGDQARLYYDSARVLLEEEVAEATVMQAWNRAYLAYVYAALGREEDALREGKLSVETWPVASDARSGPVKIEILAKTYTLLGKYDLAIEQLEYLDLIPGGLMSLPDLKSAYFAPLRNHPRFQALLEKREKEHGT